MEKKDKYLRSKKREKTKPKKKKTGVEENIK